MSNKVIIIGSGLAGYTLAKEFRKLDTESSLTIVTANAGRFYSKPLLSTALTQQKAAADLAMFSAEQMAENLNADILTLKTVTGIDRENKRVFIDDLALDYSHLIFACGADTVQLPIEGDASDDVLSVNELADYEVFQAAIKNKNRIAVLGAGLVGCEFANDLINGGHKVEMIALSEHPLDTLIPREAGVVLQDTFAKLGVNWHLGQSLASVNHSGEHYELTLSSDEKIHADVVLSAIGLRPRIQLAQAAELNTNRGICVDSHMQTNDEHIFALGDCAEVNGVVMLFVAPILHSARALAKTLAGERTEVNYPAMPIVVKTPACPLAICPPPYNLAGSWNIQGEGCNLVALFHDEDSKLRGFVLTGAETKQRAVLCKDLTT